MSGSPYLEKLDQELQSAHEAVVKPTPYCEDCRFFQGATEKFEPDVCLKVDAPRGSDFVRRKPVKPRYCETERSDGIGHCGLAGVWFQPREQAEAKG